MNGLHYNRRLVAFTTGRRTYLAPTLDAALPPGDPLRRFIEAMGHYGPGPTAGDAGIAHSADAEQFARSALIPTDEFAACQKRSDAELAERFGVPVDQVARKRADLAGTERPASPPPRPLALQAA